MEGFDDSENNEGINDRIDGGNVTSDDDDDDSDDDSDDDRDDDHRSPLHPSSPSHQIRSSTSPAYSSIRGKTKVYSKLRSLDLDVDPLIDNFGVNRVLQRGKVVLLQRKYHQFQDTVLDKESNDKEAVDVRSKKFTQSENKELEKRAAISHSAVSRLGVQTERSKKSRQLKSHLRDPFVEETEQGSSKAATSDLPYEDYEQALVSPWSRSPARLTGCFERFIR